MNVNRLVFVFTVIASWLIAFECRAQKPEPVTTDFGVEFRLLQNFGILHIDSVVLQDDGKNFRAVYKNTGGIGFGGVVRVRLSDFWNIESGIYYTRRVFNMEITDQKTGFRDETSFRQIGYEIPLKGLVYIRLGERIFGNVALGVSADFFASDVESVEPIYNFRAFKLSWIRTAVLGNLGVEYRTAEDGIFYLGATFHRPFEDIMITQVNYYRDGDPPAYFKSGRLDGTYISLDFRYFFPPTKEKKTDPYRVIPDRNNM